MRIRFDDEDLRRLYEEADYQCSWLGRDVVRAYRKKMGFLTAAQSELDLYRYRALHFEKLKGKRKDQHSIRIDRRWRLILRIESDAEGRLLVVVEMLNHYE